MSATAIFRRVGQWWSDAQNLWAIIILFFPAAVATMSALTSYVGDEPWHIILFYAAGVFCFSVIGLGALSSWMRNNTIYGKIRFESLSALIGKANPTDQTYVATPSIVMKNYSLFDLYYQLVEASASLQQRVPANTNIDRAIMQIPSGGVATIQFQSIDGLRPEPMTGSAILKIKYGKSQNALNHVCGMVGQPQINVILDNEGRVIGAASNIMFRELTYE